MRAGRARTSLKPIAPLFRLPRRGLLALLLAAAGAIGVGAHSQESSRADADAMEAKIARVTAAAETPRAAKAEPLRTSFSEREINAYFEHYGDDFLPAGVTKPRATLADDRQIVARATVDLDAMQRSRERSFFDPFAFMRGSLEVVAAGTVVGKDGRGVIRFVSATVGGVAVPQALAQELLRFYTRTPERPSGFQFDQPFDLPARIESVSAARGSITVVQ